MWHWRTFIAMMLAILGWSNSASANINYSTKSNDPILIADRVYIDVSDKVSVWMPGYLTTNTRQLLGSYSESSRTAYVVVETDPNPDLRFLPPESIRSVMRSVLPEVFNADGRVIKTEDWQIGGYPGIEAFVRFNNGEIGRFRMFAIDDRLFGLAAITRERFTSESELFFSSFRLR